MMNIDRQLISENFEMHRKIADEKVREYIAELDEFELDVRINSKAVPLWAITAILTFLTFIVPLGIFKMIEELL